MREAMLWRPLSGGSVQCRLCSHFCLVRDGERGRCGVRENRGGALYTLVDEQVAALNMDPVEKKPLYHFHPGSRTLSFGTMGCNMACAWCQNASLSQPPRRGAPIEGHRLRPEQIVAMALEHGAESISYTYSEPTIFFELMRETADLAVRQGLKNILVSNGFMSPECLDALGPLIHAANIDLKGFTEDTYRDYCDARLAPILDNLRHIRRFGWWLEVTSLLIPELNDSDAEITKMAEFIAAELGPDTPWHLSRFHPDHRLTDRGPTPTQTLTRARDIGREQGLRFVYIGNAQIAGCGDTCCPKCGEVLLSRHGFHADGAAVKDGTCSGCGEPVPGVGLP